MPHDPEVIREVWEGKIPVEFVLAPEELTLIEQPKPYYEYVAIFPLVVCLTAFLVSSLLSIRPITKLLDMKLVYVLGATAGGAACVWMWFLGLRLMMYGVSVVAGVAQAGVLVASLSLTAQLIGTNTESGAFVYGVMSFFDKLANGAVYQAIQYANPINCNMDPHTKHRHCTIFYRDVMTLVPSVSLMLGLVMLTFLALKPIGVRRRDKKLRKMTEARRAVWTTKTGEKEDGPG